ncbi:YsnF/AvaK domain-containing protein [Sporosarcina sp. Marseille-Q4063]|uniref:YsnF/AvaK domain-containing protein n=1 Tax=Sporosarcina sp. Marseille-Q4063 TaxID=2810514 RepID=UPI001BAE9D82|nr:YsnF/AvaK domain-containing protein [Sporosarcina sp. Marseille-Q4063]QUW22912.1 YsnF/AvaK domain-containing protein [Sporosarcina sp. Marseille-Q4063]
MADKRFVGTFQTEYEVLNKIDELKVEGYSEEDIYVVTNDEESLSIVRGQTDVDFESPDGNWLDKFIAFISGDEPVRAAFNDMGLTEEESDRYYGEVKNGRILLYVDHEYGRTTYDRQSEFMNNYSDPNLGSNLTTEDLGATASVNHASPNIDAEHEGSLRLHEERLNVDKERVQTGEVNVGKHVVEEVQSVEVPVSREEVDIERNAVYDETAAGEVFDDGENIHIPVMEEQVEVTKRPVVNEEIVVSKREVQDTEMVSETVRREEADVDRSDEDFVNPIDRDVEDTLEKERTQYDPLTDRDRL